MQSDWIKTRCRLCGSRTVIHKDWKSPDPDCGVCKLISGKVVDAIEMLLINKYVGTPEDAKNKLRDLIKLSNGTYNENLRNGIEKSIAWRIAERQLADRVWNDKELRKATLLSSRSCVDTKKKMQGRNCEMNCALPESLMGRAGGLVERPVRSLTALR